jgi:hypothetical protein
MEDHQEANQVITNARPGLAVRRKVKVKLQITPQMTEDLLQSEPESEEYTEHVYKSDDKSGIKDQLRTDQAGPSQAGLSPVSEHTFLGTVTSHGSISQG